MLARTGLRYPSKLHCEKVASFLSDKARHHAILLAKGTEAHNRDNTDTELEFRQESNFFYLTGVQEADFYFIYDFTRNTSFLIAPDMDAAKAVWKGPDLTDKQLLKKYGVDRVVRYSALLDLLKNELKPKHIHGWGQPEKGHSLGDKAREHELEHFISHRLVQYKSDTEDNGGHHHHHHGHHHHHHQYQSHHHGPYGDHHGHRRKYHDDDDKLASQNGKHHPKDPKHPEEPEVTLLQALILARINKTPIEIALSRESTRITSDAHRLVMQSARPGMFEYQLEALFRYECARQGAKMQAYLPIVGTGVNPAYLHYTRNDTQIKNGDLVLIDAACEADCYGSDVTRTFPANGRFTSEQAAIYDLVLDMQNSVIRNMKQGVEWPLMNRLAQKIGIRGLRRLGILKGEENDLEESNVIKVFFPHGLGHLLGLNVHDDGLGLVVQRPSKFAAQTLVDDKSMLVQFNPVMKAKSSSHSHMDGQLFELPPPSTRRNVAQGSSLYATPSTRLEPGMLLTVEPGIYFNPAQIEFALQNPDIADYLDESTIRRYMSVGGVRIEDVVLILPDGSVDNITTAPKDRHEVERIVQEGQRRHFESQQMDQQDGNAGGKEAHSKEKQQQIPAKAAAAATEEPMRIKRRIGVFKKLLRAIRNMF
ncbi:hypothetical protein BGZ98_000399 [Dissophora globulifera]|nr:hypothetical protein BGZ98_000399 [Dissophora globulifera]